MVQYKRKRLIIIGGGFAGAKIARRLEGEFDLTLIDSKGYFEFTPGILRTVVDPEHIRKIQVMHTHYLRRSKVIIGDVSDIRQDKVILKKGEAKESLSFDYLVITAGSSYNAPFKEQGVIPSTRADTMRDCYLKLCRSKEILVIGGGLVGIELVGEIIDRYKDKNITIIHSRDKVLNRNNKKSIDYAVKKLKKGGVDIILNQRVLSVKNGKAMTDRGRIVDYDMAFLSTGIVPNSHFINKRFKLNDKGHILVNDKLQIEGYDNIFAAGDITSIMEEKTAQNSERQADVVIDNLRNLDKKCRLKDYKPHRRSMIISVGRWNGIFTSNIVTITGLFPALLKRLVEWRTMRVYSS